MKLRMILDYDLPDYYLKEGMSTKDIIMQEVKEFSKSPSEYIFCVEVLKVDISVINE